MKEFSVVSLMYRLHDPQKQMFILIQTFIADCLIDAYNQFVNFYSFSMEFHVVSIHTITQMDLIPC
jgi:hypothetical protein